MEQGKNNDKINELLTKIKGIKHIKIIIGILIAAIIMLVYVGITSNKTNETINENTMQDISETNATYSENEEKLADILERIEGIGKTKLFAIQGIVQTLTVILCNIYFLLIAKTELQEYLLQGYLLSIIIGLAVPTVLMFFAGGLFKYIIPFFRRPLPSKNACKIFFNLLYFNLALRSLFFPYLVTHRSHWVILVIFFNFIRYHISPLFTCHL